MRSRQKQIDDTLYIEVTSEGETDIILEFTSQIQRHPCKILQTFRADDFGLGDDPPPQNEQLLRIEIPAEKYAGCWRFAIGRVIIVYLGFDPFEAQAVVYAPRYLAEGWICEGDVTPISLSDYKKACRARGLIFENQRKG